MARVLAGMATIDQHMLTGEAQPVERGLGRGGLCQHHFVGGLASRCGLTRLAQRRPWPRLEPCSTKRAITKGICKLRAEQLADQIALPFIVGGLLAVPVLGVPGAIAAFDSHFGWRLSLLTPLGGVSYFQLLAEKRHPD